MLCVLAVAQVPQNGSVYRLPTLKLPLLLLPFYGHYTGQPLYRPAPRVKNWRILLVQFYCPRALADGN